MMSPKRVLRKRQCNQRDGALLLSLAPVGPEPKTSRITQILIAPIVCSREHIRKKQSSQNLKPRSAAASDLHARAATGRAGEAGLESSGADSG
jgi:hypothetical protein